MAKFTTVRQQESGIALGGIGTGTVELWPDGEFHEWQIANVPRWAERHWEERVDDGEGATGSLSFWVRAQSGDGVPVIRKLGMKTAPEDFTYRMFPWNKPVERIRFDGRFPLCDLSYEDSALPVEVSLRAVAPFVPHRTEDSATPGFYLDFTLTNPGETPLSVSLLSALEPGFCNRRRCVNERYRDGDRVGIFLNAPELMPWDEGHDDRDRGSLCWSAEGGEISWIAGEHFRFLREYVASSALGVSQESFLFGFRKTGALPDTDAGTPPTPIPALISDLKDEAADRILGEMMNYPFARSLMERVRRIHPGFPQSREEKDTFLAACRSSLNRMREDFGSCALCSSVELAPGETRRVRFILSWYFPNHFSANHDRLGHWYENRFRDAREVNRHLAAHRAEIADQAAAFADLLYRTDLPQFYPDAWSGHLSTIVKDSWYLKNGSFGLWEGLGYCGFHTTDITYHASFGLLALFPDLQKGQMEMGAAFQREDGRVHHCFYPDLAHVDGGFDRVDMNPQFVLMVCRDALFTGDRGYLERLWIPVQKAMDNSLLLDTDGDGLPDKGTRRNTYDAWNFSGAPTYICVLWLSALKAAARLASVLGEEKRREEWEDLLEKGLASLEAKLWNGRYYDLWRREDENGSAWDSALMTDQLDGEWFLRMAGIGGNLPDSRVREVLAEVFRWCYTPDGGLVNVFCPPDRTVTLQTFENCQAEANWTGIGYAVAALALSVGMREEADAVVRTIHENQIRFGKFWEHWECGFRYTRPLSSWTTMIAASGLSADAAEKTVRFRPAAVPLTVPFFTCGPCGTAEFRENACRIRLWNGPADGWTFEAPDGMTVTVTEA